ncbi:Rubrerythrin-2 [subsurface metagenome]
MIFISVVIENLKEAIIGESNAKRKYELFAEKALNEGFPEIAHLFKAISTAESIHIKNHLKAIEEITKKSVDLNAIVNIEEKVLKKQVRNTRNNLIQAIAGETFEFKKMYKGFMKNAKKNDVYLAEFSFDLARMAEIVHSKLYIRFLKKLDKKEPFEDIDIYVCRICGNVELKKIPKICPNCEHDQKFFMKA